MFKYDDRFSIDSDDMQWLLHDLTRYTNRKGKPSSRDRVTYHANLQQVAQTIIDRSIKDCPDLLELVETLVELETKLDRYLEENIE